MGQQCAAPSIEDMGQWGQWESAAASPALRDPFPTLERSRSGQQSSIALLLALQEEGTGGGHKPLGCGAGWGARAGLQPPHRAGVGPWVQGWAEGRGGSGPTAGLGLHS